MGSSTGTLDDTAFATSPYVAGEARQVDRRLVCPGAVGGWLPDVYRTGVYHNGTSKGQPAGVLQDKPEGLFL